MKFGRLLRTTAEDLPEMESLFVSYKQLKKQLKRLPFKDQLTEQDAVQTLTEEENNFVTALSNTVHEVNQRFLDKEENSIIRVERLESELAAATTPEQLNKLHKEFVDFHGEVLLLLHWSILAYTATVKILKKHHKRTGLLVRAPQLGDLLSQPFCSTELMTSIAHRVEEDIQNLASRMGLAPPTSLITDPTGLAGSCSLPNLATGVDFGLLQRLADESQSTGEEQDTSQAAAADEDASPHSVLTASVGMEMQQGRPAGTAAAASLAGEQGQQKRRHAGEGSGGSEQRYQEEEHQQQEGLTQPLAKRLCAGVNQAEHSSGRQLNTSTVQPDLLRAKQQQQQGGEQGSNGTPEAADVSPAMPEAPSAAATLQGAASEHPRASAAPCTCSADRDPAAAVGQTVLEPSQQKQHTRGSSSSSGGGGAMAPPMSCWRHGSILRQTQVALTTWAHLKSHASTPSTVIAHPAQGVSNPMACTESSTA